MRRCLGLSLLLLGELFLLPLLLLLWEQGAGAAEESAQNAAPLRTEAPVTESAAAETEPAAETSAAGFDETNIVTLSLNEEVTELSLADYLWGVVAAEMPASFEEEALKAQAVAARTETLYRKAHQKDAHPEAAVCSDSGCCQAYISREDAWANWGENAQLYDEKITQAVSETDGLAAVYEGEVIEALFHSSSAGNTLSAEEVWGSAVPYLVEVSSPEGEEVPNYYSVVSVSAEDFKAALLGDYPQMDLSGDPSGWTLEPQYSDSGTLSAVNIGGVTVKATELRSRFGLRSARFTLAVDDGELRFYVTGYGHGVGMSQYGANELAREGYGFQEILCWYYSGVEIVEQ